MAAVFTALRSPILLVFSLAAAPSHLQDEHRTSLDRRIKLTSRRSLSLSESLLRKATLAAAPCHQFIELISFLFYFHTTHQSQPKVKKLPFIQLKAFRIVSSQSLFRNDFVFQPDHTCCPSGGFPLTPPGSIAPEEHQLSPTSNC